MQNGVYAFDARSIAKRFRHAAIFGALNALDKGKPCAFAMIITRCLCCSKSRTCSVTVYKYRRYPKNRVRL
jgi:hypothetical protein